jgi:hypothetical protein
LSFVKGGTGLTWLVSPITDFIIQPAGNVTYSLPYGSAGKSQSPVGISTSFISRIAHISIYNTLILIKVTSLRYISAGSEYSAIYFEYFPVICPLMPSCHGLLDQIHHTALHLQLHHRRWVKRDCSTNNNQHRRPTLRAVQYLGEK